MLSTNTLILVKVQPRTKGVPGCRFFFGPTAVMEMVSVVYLEL